MWRHWLDALGDGNTLVRYDERGCGLSDREVGDLSVDTWVADLESVVDAAGLDRFALLGISQGAAVALAYAARHPERVTHLVLYGGYGAGASSEDRTSAAEEALIAAIRAGWEDPNPPSAACSACCSSPTEPRSRWRGTTSSSDARPRPRPRRVLRRTRNIDVVELAPR